MRTDLHFFVKENIEDPDQAASKKKLSDPDLHYFTNMALSTCISILTANIYLRFCFDKGSAVLYGWQY